MNTTRLSLLDKVRDLDNNSAWIEFDKLYRPLVTHYARRWGLSPLEAEEIAQQCLDVVVGRIGNFERQASFRGWLRAIVNNKVRHHFRERHKRAIGGDDQPELADESEPQQDDVWDREWRLTHLAYCLDIVRHELAAHTMQAFELYVVHDWSVEDICHVLGMTPNQVYVSKSRVVKRIREYHQRIMKNLYGEDA